MPERYWILIEHWLIEKYSSTQEKHLTG